MPLRHLVRLLCLCACGLALAAAGPPAPAPPAPLYDRVEVGEAKTSIYIGSVTMEMPVFVRRDGRFEGSYHARVFPYFFYNESGRIAIDVSPDQLAQLGRGEPIDFTGQAIRDDGEVHLVRGHAAPADASTGQLKVSVYVTKHIKLIFHSTYRFVGP